MKRIISITTAIALSLSITPKAQATPAALAPIALCSTGVGCVLVGTAIVGGVVVYTWKRNDGKKVHANRQGQILKTEYLEDPEEEMQRIGNNATNGRIIIARNATEAFNKCASRADGRKTSQPLDLKNGRFQCRYH